MRRKNRVIGDSSHTTFIAKMATWTRFAPKVKDGYGTRKYTPSGNCGTSDSIPCESGATGKHVAPAEGDPRRDAIFSLAHSFFVDL
jgi:hypothetical protein